MVFAFSFMRSSASRFLSHVVDYLTVVRHHVCQDSLFKGLLSLSAFGNDVGVGLHHGVILQVRLQPDRCQSRRYQFFGVGVVVFCVYQFEECCMIACDGIQGFLPCSSRVGFSCLSDLCLIVIQVFFNCGGFSGLLTVSVGLTAACRGFQLSGLLSVRRDGVLVRPSDLAWPSFSSQRFPSFVRRYQVSRFRSSW